MATIKDVAKAAGVSFKTVSRVVNGEKRVGAEARERVQQAIRDLGYKPTLAARQLAGQRSYLIGLVVLGSGISYISRMMIAMGSACRDRGYNLITATLDYKQHNASDTVAISFSARPDSVILTPPYCNDQRILDHFEREKIAVVRVAAVTEGYGLTVPVNEEPCALELMRHLLGLGHKRIGIIAPPLPRRASEARLEAYCKALDEAGIAFDPDLVLRGDFSFAAGVQATTSLMALPDRPTAIFATGDEMAAGVLAEAARLGYRVPDDLAVAGFDDSPIARMVFPPLTTVHQPVPDIARAAVEAAINPAFQPQPFSYQLIIRGSTDGSRQHCLEPYPF
ncbi:LacI family transcriptional regulator [Novosphingobium umbonatum]|uniref:LacI family transcriptional regulator n=1 Tax=Novosphingobium umbonatum TaxID=1908524 RepID=A0A437N7I2_9SPHN|nr:LacI family DNA-binding transcriptional regulator [Novosphingobium umbonatum]RVU05841.1 LacI family transcriptional regulator [Novosphingobium umbonatum]